MEVLNYITTEKTLICQASTLSGGEFLAYTGGETTIISSLTGFSEIRPFGSESPVMVDIVQEENLLDNLMFSRLSGLMALIAEKIGQLPEVKYIFSNYEGNQIHIWTIIDDLDRAAREKIYQIEADIIETAPYFDFDFQVIARMNRYYSEIAPYNAALIFKR